MAPRLLPLPPTMSVSLDLAAAVPTPGPTVWPGGQPVAGATGDAAAIAALGGGGIAASADFSALLGLLGGAAELEAADDDVSDEVPPTDLGMLPNGAPATATAAAAATAAATLAIVLPFAVPDAPPAAAGDSVEATSATVEQPAVAGARPALDAQEALSSRALPGRAATVEDAPTPEDAATAGEATDGSASDVPVPETTAADRTESADPKVLPPRDRLPTASQAPTHSAPHKDPQPESTPSEATTAPAAAPAAAAPAMVAAVTEPSARDRGTPAQTRDANLETSARAPEVVSAIAEGGGQIEQHEERAPGRRGSDGEAGKAMVPTLAHSESPTARRTDGGPDPSAPSALPSTPHREGSLAPKLAPAPEPLRDVDRLLRMHELRAMPAPDRGEMRLEVATDLGRVEVRVAVRADAVHASIYAQHDQAREALETNRSNLAAALERSNLRLEGFTVGLGQHQQQTPGEQGRQDGSSFRMGSGPAPLAAMDDMVLEPVARTRGLSLRA